MLSCSSHSSWAEASPRPLHWPLFSWPILESLFFFFFFGTLSFGFGWGCLVACSVSWLFWAASSSSSFPSHRNCKTKQVPIRLQTLDKLTQEGNNHLVNCYSDQKGRKGLEEEKFSEKKQENRAWNLVIFGENFLPFSLGTRCANNWSWFGCLAMFV